MPNSLALHEALSKNIGIPEPTEHQQSCNLSKSRFMARPIGSAVVNHVMADAKSWPFGLPSSRLRPYWPARSACSGYFHRRKILKGYPSTAQWSVVILSVFCWKVQSGGQYGLGLGRWPLRKDGDFFSLAATLLNLCSATPVMCFT